LLLLLAYDFYDKITDSATDAFTDVSCRRFAFAAFCTTHPEQKVSKDVNRKLPARNTTVQLLALCTNPERHSAQRHRRTDRGTDGQTTLWCQ